jgi:general transcription factor 3C polypeptide 3 (transcription factor C subunit 4)
MKEFQFVTDTYRLFATLNRLSSRPNNWYNNGPTQKFILRQLKAIDYALMGDTHDKNDKTIFQDRAGLSSKDENGNTIHPTDFDVVLLMIYGHILYAGKSYQYGLSRLNSDCLIKERILTICARLLLPSLCPRS